MWYQNHVWNNSNQLSVDFNIGPGNVKAEQTVSISVSHSGELSVYFNGNYMGTTFKNLPDAPLYGVIGLENYGSHSKFRLGKYNGSIL